MDSCKEFEEIINRTKRINVKLRQELFSVTPKLAGIRKIPFHGTMINGMPTESLGPFPEFILPTHPCAKTLQGYCSPCFFSKVPMSSRSSKEVYDSLLVQTEFIVKNFDDIVINYQARGDVLKDIYDVTFCYACNGSLFSNTETTQKTRYIAFKMLADEIERRRIKPLVYLETCVSDYIRFLKSDEFNVLYPLLKKLNAVILFGFESSNSITRNLIYLKDLSLSDFEYVISKNSELGIASGAFLYLGFHSMTQNEILNDAINSIRYLTSKNVMPVLMFPNIHEYTLTHLLYTYDRYNLIDPQTALKIFSFAQDITSNNKYFSENRCDQWLMGDLFGGPPPPPNNFFNNKNKISCDKCSELIRKTLQHARQNHCLYKIEDIESAISVCNENCITKYLDFIKKEELEFQDVSLIDRIMSNITFAENHCDEYLNNIKQIKVV